MLDRHEQELAIFWRTVLMVEVLGQFEGVARTHGPAVAGAGEGLGLGFDDLQVAADQRLALVRQAMTVGPEEIVHLVGRNIALFIEAAHVDGQRISWLLVIERLDGHLARLQYPVAAPLGDRVTGFGDKGAVVADLRLFGQRLQSLGFIHDDQAVPVPAVIEVEEQAVLLQQTQHEIQVGFAILGYVTVGLERLQQAELECAQPAVMLENGANDRLNGLLLKDPRVNASRQHPQPRAQCRAVTRQATIAAQQVEPGDVTMDVAYAAVGQLDVETGRLADQRFEFEPGILADQRQLEAEQRG